MILASDNTIHSALTSIEPCQQWLEKDLKQLAAYLVKIGSNVDIVFHRSKQHRVHKHKELNLELMQKLVLKYKLNWSPAHDKRQFNESSRSLIQIAHSYPKYFVEQAALSTPGGYDERRFWWCANNFDYHDKYYSNSNNQSASKFGATYNQIIRSSPSRLLSDVLYRTLSINEPKLMIINALHLSVKHSDSKVLPIWYERNRNWIANQVNRQKFESNELIEERKRLRELFQIEQTEKELNVIHVDHFFEWWNLTGLRR